MNIVLWIVAGLLALLFLAAGAMKLIMPKEKLGASPNMAWTEGFPPGVIKLIGTLEVLAAIGLILPAALSIAPILTPLAAVSVILLMIGAMITHARRGERQPIVVNAVLLVLAGLVAVGRFGPVTFG